MVYRAEPARAHDLDPALDLLKRADLPKEGVVEHFGNYLAVHDHASLVGLCGIEVHGDDGLLRSVAVDPDYRGEKIGAVLVQGAIALAAKMRLRDLYLLTSTARDYFLKHGFTEHRRDEAPPPIRESWEFRAGCPSTSSLLRRPIESQAR